jgi:hypothetical protein
MARSINDIQSEIINQKNNYASLNDLNSPSATAIWRLWTFVVATAIHLHEVLWDTFRIELITIVNRGSFGSEGWLVRKAFEFQYDSVTPQVLDVDVNTFEAKYVVEDPNLRIITRASCSSSPDGSIALKVVKGVSPNLVPLVTDELDAMKSYIDRIKMAGQRVNVLSNLPDRLYIDLDIYYDAQNNLNIVRNNIKAAINTYLNELDFDGVVYYQRVVDAIQSVPGVNDVVINEMAGRAQTDSFEARTIFIKDYFPSSGYLILEDSVGNGFDDKVNMIAV